MKLDMQAVKKIEEERGFVSLLTLRERRQYLYMKVRKEFADRIEYVDIGTKKGTEHFTPFVPVELVTRIAREVEGRKVSKKKGKKRGFLGRMYYFCKECDRRFDCSLDFPCGQRDEYLAKKAFAEKVKGDDRYWNNGVPKKSKVLCQSSKYKYAHKKTAGQCQKEKCEFYCKGICELGIDKE